MCFVDRSSIVQFLQRNILERATRSYKEKQHVLSVKDKKWGSVKKGDVSFLRKSPKGIYMYTSIIMKQRRHVVFYF
jgi:hypothetical protein